ncbi:MAG: InlB B-repeat-containing protein, partial [Alphaproteobacteria bacterium]|nr:InlB B-repeat-containing protein [Alphaproteobacteria bacterium]
MLKTRILSYFSRILYIFALACIYCFSTFNNAFSADAIITYNYTNGGSGCSNETYTLGTAKELTCIPTKSGYIFTGWYDSATGGNKITQITALDTGDKTFYAQWTEDKFQIKTIELTDNGIFPFELYAGGTFYVDWGDGTTEKIERDNSSPNDYTHVYKNGGVYTIRFGGVADSYYQNTGSGNTPPVIKFYDYITEASGSLSKIFPVSQPYMFASTFAGDSHLTTISDTLFSNLNASDYMFNYTFSGCTSLQNIPSDLFSDITTSANGLFMATFSGCSALTTIPSGLFSHITEPAENMFGGTFNGCSNLNSITDGNNTVNYIPVSMFSNLEQYYKDNNILHTATYPVFNGTFGWTALATECPTGTADYLFANTPDIFSAWGGTVSCIPYITCPNGFTSNTTATDISQCYTEYSKQCSEVNPVTIGGNTHISNVIYKNATAMGRQYASGDTEWTLNDVSACDILNTICETGYHYEPGNDGIDVDNTISSSTYSDSGMTWNATFSYGTITGKAICSSTKGKGLWMSGDYLVTTPDDITVIPYDDINEDSTGQYCYCQIDGYTPLNSATQILNGDWTFVSDRGSASKCASNCASRCSLNFGTSTEYRTAVLNAVGGQESTCKANTYTVQFNSNANDTTETMNSVICTYNKNCVLPANIFSRNAYSFIGWTTTQSDTEIAYTDKDTVLNLTDTENGVVTLYAQWEIKQIQCVSGYYLQANKSIANDLCLIGNYCPGSEIVEFSATENQCMVQCPVIDDKQYTTISGATSITQCYTEYSKQCSEANPITIGNDTHIASFTYANDSAM